VDLIIILLLTLICFPVITLSEGIIRIILGIVFLLIFPGYTMMAALFPNKNSVTGIGRAGLTPVLSFALIALAGLVLNYTPWGLKLVPLYIAMAIIILLASGIALWRRSSLPVAERFTPKMNIRFSRLRNTSNFGKALYVGLIVALAAVVYLLVQLIVQPITGQAFTEFYIVSPKIVLENNPYLINLSDKLEIGLAINNHENTSTSYNLTVILDGEQTQSIGPILLTDKEAWNDQVTISPSKAGENQKVEFILYKGEEPEPYLALHLWLNVTK
jgi:uncharacterized membrane protein